MIIMTEPEETWSSPRKPELVSRCRTNGTLGLPFEEVHFDCPSNSCIKAMAPHSSTLAWKIPWTEEPGRLQSMGLLRVGHD